MPLASSDSTNAMLPPFMRMVRLVPFSSGLALDDLPDPGVHGELPADGVQAADGGGAGLQGVDLGGPAEHLLDLRLPVGQVVGPVAAVPEQQGVVVLR